jgi:hypothetical protein
MKSTTTQNEGKLLAHINRHADAAVQCGMHCPIEHIPGFTRSHCMPPSGECLQRIAPAATKVINSGCKHKSLTKHNF